MPQDRSFKDLKVLPVKELVFYGVNNEESLNDVTDDIHHLCPQDFHQKLESKNKDIVVIDVRNAYESVIGRFSGQIKTGGAKLIDPMMRKSTDFPKWLEKDSTKEDLKNKEVLMYCTGGVRCEKASALLRREMGDSVKGIYQLQGGIEK